MSKIIIPSEFMGVPVNPQTLERVLRTPVKKEVEKAVTRSMPALGEIDSPENWLLLEGREHGKDKYENILVSMHRLGHSPRVEKAATDLGFSVSNTATEQYGSVPYIGNINWHEAIKLNLQLGCFTLNLRRGMDLREDLENGSNGTKKLYDGKGNEIRADRLRIVYNEIFAKRDPWRAEWLDASFLVEDDNQRMMSGHILDNGNLRPETDEELEKCVMKDTYVNPPSINRQGLPTKASKGETPLYLWSPANGAVAGFVADSCRVGLGCDWDPDDRFDWLGVRPARAKN